MLEYAARPLLVAFSLLAVYALVQLISTGELGWLLSMLWVLGIVGSVGYSADLGVLSRVMLLVGYAGSAGAIVLGGYALLTQVELAGGLNPTWLEVVLAAGLIVSLTWLWRRSHRQSQSCPRS